MNEEKTVIRTFTSGNIPRQLFAFVLPFMAANVLQVLYSTVDMVIVGQVVGAEGLSAVSAGGQVINLCTMICTGLCMGGQVLISQLLGARKKKELGQVIGTLFLFVLICALVVSAVLFLVRGWICTHLNVPGDAYAMAMDYLGICAVGQFFCYGYNMVSAVLRGLGDSRHPLVFVAIASLINLVLDILLTGYLGWGVSGAAAATIIGQAASFLFALAFLYRHRDMLGFEFSLGSLRIIPQYLQVILQQGLPVAASSALIYVSMFYVTSLINRAGVVESATFGVGVKIDDLCNKVSIAIRYAATPMVAQNYAAKNIKRVKQIVAWAWIYGIVFHLCFMVIYLLFGTQLFMLFTSDKEILALSPVFIRNIIWTFIPLAFLRGNNALIQGIGNARLSMCMSLLDGMVCRIGFSYLFGVFLDMGFAGFVLGYGLAPAGAAVPGMIYCLSGIWQKKQSLVDQLEKE
ncbi:MAG: MATE family efflux transporter [Lachnospiraceae bacterium]|nr:MATE family efflux transporter [Lachnospiraceae bacterium]